MYIENSRATIKFFKGSITDIVKEEIKRNNIKCSIITREDRKGGNNNNNNEEQILHIERNHKHGW